MRWLTRQIRIFNQSHGEYLQRSLEPQLVSEAAYVCAHLELCYLFYRLLTSNLRDTAVLYEIFLPEGFPESVSADYVPYQIFDSIQALASSFTGTLATKAILMGVGVGDNTATATAATLNWVRDSDFQGLLRAPTAISLG